MVEEAIMNAIANFPNFAGMALLALVMYNLLQRMQERDDEHYDLLVALLTECMGNKIKAQEIIRDVRKKKPTPQ